MLVNQRDGGREAQERWLKLRRVSKQSKVRKR